AGSCGHDAHRPGPRGPVPRCLGRAAAPRWGHPRRREEAATGPAGNNTRQTATHRLAALDLGRHLNASLQLLPEAGAQRTLKAGGWIPLFGKRLGSLLGDNMRPQPRGELLAVDLARRHLENHVLLLVDSRANFVAIQYQEDFHGGMPRSFVPVEKRMILDQGIAERYRFVHERGIQLFAAKSHLWLRESGL